MSNPKPQNSKFTKEDFDSLNALKSDINLVDFACHKFGYIPDWQYPKTSGKPRVIKSSANSIRLIHKDNPMDCVLIARKSGSNHYVYKSTINDDDSGTIIDFVKYRYDEFTISKFRKFCKNYQSAIKANLFQPIATNRIYGQIGANDEFRTTPSAANLTKLTDSTYLSNRGLENSTIDKHFKNSYNLLENNGSTSIVFPYYKTQVSPDKGISLYLQTYQKYSEVNDIKKQFITGNKDSSVWMGFFDKTKPVTSIIVSESPLDAASLSVIKPSVCGNNPILTASGGDFPFSVKDTYSNLSNFAGNPSLILANDNDCKGLQYNAKLLASLPFKQFVDEDFYDNNKALDNASIQVGVSKYKGYMNWEFSHNSNDNKLSLEEHLPVFTGVRDYYLQENYELNKMYDKGDTFEIKTEFHENKSSIRLEFQNLKENWDLINDSLLFLRYGNSENILIEKSICKDFNDDLKVIKGIDYKGLHDEPELVKDFVKQGFLNDSKAKEIEKEVIKFLDLQEKQDKIKTPKL